MALGDATPKVFAARDTTEVTVAVGLLDLREFVDHRVEATMELTVRIGTGCHHQRECRQVVSGGMSIQSATLPVAVRPCLGLQPCFATKRCQQSVGIVGQEVLTVDLDRLGKRTLKQTHVFQRK